MITLMIRSRLGHVCLFVCLFVDVCGGVRLCVFFSLCVCLFVCLMVYGCVCLSVCVWLFVCLMVCGCRFVCLCLMVCVGVFCLYIYVGVRMRAFLFIVVCNICKSACAFVSFVCPWWKRIRRKEREFKKEQK